MSNAKSVFKHGSLKLQQKSTIVFASFSKKNYYLRFQVSAFILLEGCVPISPFMNFDYYLGGLVDKNSVRIANNTMIQRTDELWVFGEVSDGVLAEVALAKKFNRPVRFFSVSDDVKKIRELSTKEVTLEDVSPWMWDWVLEGKNIGRWHPRLQLKKTYPLIYPAYSKRNFFWQMQISKFCIEKRVIPLNPFMLFRYFLGDLVPRETIYRSNNNIVRISDGVWVFGEVSDGVLAEVKMKKEAGGEAKFFKIIDGNPVRFRKIPLKSIKFEDDLGKYQHVLESNNKE
ncbi:hypothetical protein KKD61_04830 [Patescibacteria group bacterium]|nr:hypothetical protein [Patescibacteria group bacterium]